MANRQPIIPGGNPPVAVPLTPGIVAGGFVFVSGQTGQEIRDGQAYLGKDMAEQTRFCLDRIKRVVETAGSSMDKVVKCTVYVTDISQFAAMNDVYKGYFPTDPPTRTTVEVSSLARPGLLVEIEAIALA